MKISLILTCKNESSNIPRLLNSVLEQSIKPNEMIITDAGSTDSTIEIIREYQRKYEWIKLIFKKDVSRGKGRNIAIAEAKNQVIAVTDAGCYLDHNWLKNLVHPITESDYDVSIGYYKSHYENVFEFFEGILIVPNHLDTARISSRSLAFKKNVWEKTGGYEESVEVGEDTLFHWRLLKNDFKIKFSKDAIVFWMMPKTMKELFKKFFAYGQGYWQTIKLKEFRKFLYFIILAYLWFIIFILSLLSRQLFLTYIIVGFLIIAHLGLGIIYLLKTKKLSAVVYTPYIFFVKNLAFLFGFTFGKMKRSWSQ